MSAVEGVSLISSEKKLEEESPNGKVTVSSSSDAPSLNSMLGSSLSPLRNQFSGCSGTDGTTSKWPKCEIVFDCLDTCFAFSCLLIFLLAIKVGI